MQPTIGNNITLSFTNPVKYEYIPVDYIHLTQQTNQCYMIAGLQATKTIFRFMDDVGMLPENGKKIYNFLNTGKDNEKIYHLCNPDSPKKEYMMGDFFNLNVLRILDPFTYISTRGTFIGNQTIISKTHILHLTQYSNKKKLYH